MIYGIYIGLVIVVCGVIHEWLSWSVTIGIGIAAALAIIFFGVISRWKTGSTANISPSASTSGGTASAPIPSAPSTTPAPVPATATKTSWVWPVIVGILAIVVIVKVIAPMLKAINPPPRATAPQRQLQKHVVRQPLEFLGAENVVNSGPGWVKIQKERGRANFCVKNIPIIPGAKYKIYLHSKRSTTGLDWLEINAGKGSGAPFCYKNHPASDHPIETVFFEEGMGGEAKYFCSRDNFMRLWGDDDLIVQLDKQPYVEITYWR